MLVLSRKKGESILIGEDIEISIIEITNDQIKLGIKAPKEVAILRKELYVSIEHTNRDAEQSPISMTELKEQFNLLKKEKS
ncbi:carbon storage regulator [Paenibacillus sp. MY03]|uniref:carbon storage regulator CsrA n=1 Tax=Paenibacillus sp. MY03 TaxID=302980 RepID=UPI000B3C970E|nr:carbon storage regulator CsrA [Paenibacillus sp. MY03]OUS75147.1 carbon storage regulator [Paenibacillus sp. MY03]